MKIFIASIISLCASAAFAQGYNDRHYRNQGIATVVSVQPRYQTFYQRQCHQERVYSDNSTMGTVIGGVAGGIIGNQVGNGSGRDAATILGAIVGAGVGNRIGEDQRNESYREVCNNIPINRQVGEVVIFEYKGQRFTQYFTF